MIIERKDYQASHASQTVSYEIHDDYGHTASLTPEQTEVLYQWIADNALQLHKDVHSKAPAQIEQDEEMKVVEVQSVVIDWPDQTLTITDKNDESKHLVPLDQTIRVMMAGEREKQMKAGALGEYMSHGYIIEQISFKEE